MESTVMVFHTLLCALKGSQTPSPAGTKRRRQPARKRPATRCSLEALEDRSLPSGSPLGTGALQATYGQLPLAFEVNQGQAPAGVDFQSFGAGYGLSLSPGQAILTLRPQAGVGSPQAAADVLGMQLVGANAHAPVSASDPLITRTNYLVGSDPSQWHTKIRNYGRVDYHNVYPGIDLAYYGNQGQLEYDFRVAPGADADVIRLAIQGAQGLALDAAGNLVVHTAAGDVVEEAPVLYQIVNGVRQPVPGRYVLLTTAASPLTTHHSPLTTNQIGFQVGPYDHSRPLVIDPILSYSFAVSAHGWAIAADGSGAAYITGPGPAGAVMVGKLNPAGTAFVYLTYLGDNTGKEGWGDAIAVDGSGNAYITGEPSGNFPTTANAFSTTAAGLFMTKLDPTGANLLYSTFIPGGDNHYTGKVYTWAIPGGIAVDSAGNIYVTGMPPDSTLTGGTGTFSVTLVTAGAQSIMVNDTTNPGITGSETGITVTSAAATHFVLSGPTSIAAGTAFSLTVTAVDAYGNTATGYAGTVHFSDSVGGATLPGNYTFQASDQGVHTFSRLKLKTKGVQTITVMDTLNNSILGTWTIDVT
jgi:hypothetical protein